MVSNGFGIDWKKQKKQMSKRAYDAVLEWFRAYAGGERLDFMGSLQKAERQLIAVGYEIDQNFASELLEERTKPKTNRRK